MDLLILSGALVLCGAIMVIAAFHRRAISNVILLFILGVVTVIFGFVALEIHKYEQAKTKAKIAADIESRTMVTRGGVATRFYTGPYEPPRCFLKLYGLSYRFLLPEEFLLSCRDIHPEDVVKIVFLEPLDPSQEDVEVLELIDLTYEINTWRLDTNQYPVLLPGCIDASEPILKSQQRKAEEL